MPSHPKPLQASLAGVGLSLSVHSLLVLNGSVLGVSGLLHSSARGDTEAVLGVLGLVLSGVVAGRLESAGPSVFSMGFPATILAGFLVGAGTRLANGCTSGHMIAGLSRFSRRSLVATVTFFLTAAATTQILHRESLPLTADADWSLGGRYGHVYALNATLIPLLVAILFPPTLVPDVKTRSSASRKFFLWPKGLPLRPLACLLTSFTFGISLSLGNMVDSKRVLAFLVLPFSRAFDPTLAFLAGTALPLSVLLYRYARPRRPRFGEKWAVPSDIRINVKLVCGSVLFGIGWGICGICPGPALVNVGRVLCTGDNISVGASWLLSMICGGFLVDRCF